MPAYQHLDVTRVGDVTIVRFCNRRITEDFDIQEFGNEVFDVVEKEKPQKLLLSFSTVEFLGSSAFGKLITLERKVRCQGGAVKLSNIRVSIYEVLVIVKLNRLFDIREDEADALAAFCSAQESRSSPGIQTQSVHRQLAVDIDTTYQSRSPSLANFVP